MVEPGAVGRCDLNFFVSWLPRASQTKTSGHTHLSFRHQRCRCEMSWSVVGVTVLSLVREKACVFVRGRRRNHSGEGRGLAHPSPGVSSTAPADRE